MLLGNGSQSYRNELGLFLAILGVSSLFFTGGVPLPLPTHSLSGFGSSRPESAYCNPPYPLTQHYPQLHSAICVNPNIICRPGSNGCLYPSTAKVHLWVNATGNSRVLPPWVQVVFVVESTPFDGGYDPTGGGYGPDYGTDPCKGPCEESDGLAYLAHNIKNIVEGITMNNAGALSSSQVTFSMVDYFSTVYADHDDGDGSEYNVDVSAFLPADPFANQVTSMVNNNNWLGGNWVSLSNWYSDSDFSDSFLSSSMITALYGALKGTNLNWVNNATTYHMIIWVGSTLPRDTAYLGDYCVTYGDSPYFDYSCPSQSSPCEPAYFISQPNCETLQAITALARSEKVIINAIDLPDGMTKLNSGDYSSTGSTAQNDVKEILGAGCYLAQQTGGVWEGPSPSSTGVGFTCSAAATGNGAGNLTDTWLSNGWKWGNNPSLGWALTHVQLPYIIDNVSATGVGRDAFQYIPSGALLLSIPTSSSEVFSCIHNGVNVTAQCQKAVQTPVGTGMGWGWPFSEIDLNDSWSVVFSVSVSPFFSTNQTYNYLPADACLNGLWWTTCTGPIGSYYSEMRYTNYAGLRVNQSLPPAFVTVVIPLLPPLPSERWEQMGAIVLNRFSI